VYLFSATFFKQIKTGVGVVQYVVVLSVWNETWISEQWLGTYSNTAVVSFDVNSDRC